MTIAIGGIEIGTGDEHHIHKLLRSAEARRSAATPLQRLEATSY
jgi:hypothetical protein